MTITFPLTFPTITGIAKINIRSRSLVGMTQSPFTGVQQIHAHQGQFWEADVILPIMKRASAADWQAFLIALNGMKGTFLMGDPAGVNPRGSADATPGTPLVAGASQTGQDLNIDGLPAGANGYLEKGDWIQLGTGINTELYMCLTQVNSDSAGEATLTLWPDLRSSPLNNAVIVVEGALGFWRLANNTQEWDVDEAQIYGMSFSCVEAINV